MAQNSETKWVHESKVAELVKKYKDKGYSSEYIARLLGIRELTVTRLLETYYGSEEQ